MFKKIWQMFFVFFKIGLFTIGGGMAMMALIRDEFVEKQKAISDEDITDVLALSQSLPGVIAINASTFVGYRMSGILGAFIATLGVVTPSFIIIFIIYLLFTNDIANNLYLKKAFMGINAGITALILSATIKMSKTAIKDNFGKIVTLLGFIMVLFLQFDIAMVVIISSILGYLYYGYLYRHGRN